MLPETPNIRLLLILLLVLVFAVNAAGSTLKDVRIEDYEGRQITSVEVVIEGAPEDRNAQAEFLALLKVAPNTQFSAVRVRDSLQALFDSGRIANARVEVVGGNCEPHRPGCGFAS